MPEAKKTNPFALAALFLFAIGIFGYLIGREWYQGARESWLYRPTIATVTEYLPPDKNRSDEKWVGGRIAYQFQVDGVRHQSIFPDSKKIDMPRLNWSVLQNIHKPGDPITVYYDPADSNQSTLEPRIEPFTFGFLIFLTPFAILVFSEIANGFAMRRQGKLKKTTSKKRFMPVGSAAMTTYFLLSTVSTFGFLFTANLLELSYPVAFAIGAFLWLIAIPSLVWLVHRLTSPSALKSKLKTLDPTQRKTFQKRAGAFRTFIPLSLFTVIWWGIVCLMGYEVFGTLIQHLIAQQTYASTQGIVTESQVLSRSRPSRHGRAYTTVPFIQYRYEIDHQSFESDRYTFGHFKNPGNAARLVQDYPAGRAVTVYYNPAHPASAVLQLNIPSFRYYTLLFIWPFILGGISLLIVTTKQFRTQFAKQESTEKTSDSDQPILFERLFPTAFVTGLAVIFASVTFCIAQGDWPRSIAFAGMIANLAIPLYVPLATWIKKRKRTTAPQEKQMRDQLHKSRKTYK